MNTYYLTALDEQFKCDCKVINLSYEYPGYTGDEKWVIITDLTEKELIEKYDEIISSQSVEKVKQKCLAFSLICDIINMVMKGAENRKTRKTSDRICMYG